jgi:peptide/nickel transport system permease protein
MMKKLNGVTENPTNTNADEKSVPSKRSRRGVFARFVRHKAGVVGASTIIAFLVIALLAPALAPYNPNDVNMFRVSEAPSADHWLGTDSLGRDLLSRIIYGTRTSLLLGLSVVIIALIIGGSIGVISGFSGGIMDYVLGRIADIMMTFPSILIALAVVTIAGPGLRGTMIAIAISMIPRYFRLARACTLQIAESEYIEAAKAIGLRTWSILGKYIVPNIMAPMIVQSSLLIADVVLIASGLGFLGLGVRPPIAEWGQMLAEGRGHLQVAFHISLFPGIAIMLLVLGFNLLGDGLRDAMDVRIKL